MTQAVEVMVHLKQGGYMAIPMDEDSAEKLANQLFASVSGVKAQSVLRIGTFPHLYVIRTEDVSAFEVAPLEVQCEEGEEWKAS